MNGDKNQYNRPIITKEDLKEILSNQSNGNGDKFEYYRQGINTTIIRGGMKKTKQPNKNKK